MKYLKYTLVIVGLLSILSISNAFAKTYYYANIEISALHGTWTSNAQQKQDEDSQQSFTNLGTRDLLGNTYTMGGRTYSIYAPIGYSSWAYAAHGGGSASWGTEHTAPNYYELKLKTKNYNALKVSYSGSWTIDNQ